MASDVLEWKPTPPQAKFASLPWTIKEAFFGGGVGGGKSDLLLMLPLLLKTSEGKQLYQYPDFKQLFTRRTHAELKKEIVSRSRKYYLPFGATYNGSDMVWTFPRPDQIGSGGRMGNQGAQVQLGHIEHEKDVHKYDGAEYNIFSPDELTHLLEYMYLYIGFTRVRGSNPVLPKIIRGAGMPGGVGHTFVYKRFVKPRESGNVIIIDKKSGLKRFYVHSTFRDNPYLDPEYKNSLEALPEAEKRAKLGDWNAYEGQVFEEFREFHYPGEPENAIHVIEPFEIPSYWPKIVIGDWGYAAMTWIGFGAISPTGRVYLYRELTFRKTKIADWAPIVKHYVDEEEPELIKFCQSAKQDRGQEHTIQEQISTALGRPIELSGNRPGSRISGKMLIHEYLRWKPKPIIPDTEKPIYNEEFAQSLFRLKGEEAYKAYMDRFKEAEEETNLPKLQIFKTANPRHEVPLVVDAIKACVYDKTNVEDIAEFDGDDPVDGLRYFCDTVSSFVHLAVDRMKKAQQQKEIEDLFKATGDWTGFYRNMRHIESERTGIQPVSRYGRKGRR